MKIIYDDKSDLLYIRIDDRTQQVENIRVDNDVVLDIGEGQKIIGLEIMDASKRIDISRLMPAIYEKAI